MKLKAILLTAAAVLALSCEYEYVYDDDIHNSDKETDIYKIVHTDMISASFRIIELAEVFSIYQEVRSNRELALNHVEKYFGTQNSVYYEFMSIYEWGQVKLLQNGTYTAIPSNWKSYWIALNTPREVHIEIPQEHHYTVSNITNKNIWKIEASVEDSKTITISHLHAKAHSDYFGTAEVKLLEDLMMPMCKNGYRKLEPVSGKIQISYETENFSKSFQVEYHESGKTFTMENGTTIEVEPESTSRYEY